jgi:hypothetical protein
MQAAASQPVYIWTHPIVTKLGLYAIAWGENSDKLTNTRGVNHIHNIRKQ